MRAAGAAAALLQSVHVPARSLRANSAPQTSFLPPEGCLNSRRCPVLVHARCWELLMTAAVIIVAQQRTGIQQ